jgi:hypothetical protein
MSRSPCSKRHLPELVPPDEPDELDEAEDDEDDGVEDVDDAADEELPLSELDLLSVFVSAFLSDLVSADALDPPDSEALLPFELE